MDVKNIKNPTFLKKLKIKDLELLSNDIVSLQGILTDKKSRGIFGEVNLKHILKCQFYKLFGNKI